MITGKKCCGTCEYYVNDYQTVCIAFLEIKEPDDGVDCVHYCRDVLLDEPKQYTQGMTNE